MWRKQGFTLAEVLITLGIIGVVAALTLPSLIQKNNNKVVETRLKKFYSTMNQAIMMAEVDYGDKKIWYEDVAGAEIDKDGNIVPGSSQAEKWFRKYLAPYLQTTKIETVSSGSRKGALIIYFPDGSAVRTQPDHTRDWHFFPGNPDKCLNQEGGGSIHNVNGKCVFVFNFYPNSKEEGWKYHYNKGMEPYKAGWDGDIKKLYSGAQYSCSGAEKNYCTALIQMNNWTIPDDYPFKVSY